MGILAGLLLRKLANDIEDRRYLRREEREAQDFNAGLVARWLGTPENQRDAVTNYALVTHRVWHAAAFSQALATLPPGPDGEDILATPGLEPWHGPAFRTYPVVEGHLGTGWVSLGGGHRARVSWVDAADGTRWVLPPAAVEVVGAALGGNSDGRVRVSLDLERAREDLYYTAVSLNEFGTPLSQATTPENQARKAEVEELHQRVAEGLRRPEGERDYNTNYSLVWDSYRDPIQFQAAVATLPPGPGGADAKPTSQSIASPWRPDLSHTIEGHFTTGWVELGRGHRANVCWVETPGGMRCVLDAGAVAAVRSVLTTRTEGRVRLSYDTGSGDQPISAVTLLD
jgi:hypothetical protein